MLWNKHEIIWFESTYPKNHLKCSTQTVPDSERDKWDVCEAPEWGNVNVWSVLGGKLKQSVRQKVADKWELVSIYLAASAYLSSCLPKNSIIKQSTHPPITSSVWPKTRNAACWFHSNQSSFALNPPYAESQCLHLSVCIPLFLSISMKCIFYNSLFQLMFISS